MSARELTIEQARGLAQQWAERKRFDDGEVYPDDCEACGGEAVPADAIDEHEDVCMYASHDVLDDGGGKCTTCGELLPACPVCGPYHGRQAPPLALDEHELAALLGWVRQRMAGIRGIQSVVADGVANDLGLTQQQAATLCELAERTS